MQKPRAGTNRARRATVSAIILGGAVAGRTERGNRSEKKNPGWHCKQGAACCAPTSLPLFPQVPAARKPGMRGPELACGVVLEGPSGSSSSSSLNGLASRRRKLLRSVPLLPRLQSCGAAKRRGCGKSCGRIARVGHNVSRQTGPCICYGPKNKKSRPSVGGPCVLAWRRATFAESSSSMLTAARGRGAGDSAANFLGAERVRPGTAEGAAGHHLMAWCCVRPVQHPRQQAGARRSQRGRSCWRRPRRGPHNLEPNRACRSVAMAGKDAINSSPHGKCTGAPAVSSKSFQAFRIDVFYVFIIAIREREVDPAHTPRGEARRELSTINRGEGNEHRLNTPPDRGERRSPGKTTNCHAAGCRAHSGHGVRSFLCRAALLCLPSMASRP